MKHFYISIFSFFLISSFDALSQDWKNECVGYYKLQLPDNLEVALYPVDLIINPLKNPAWRKNEFVRRYLFPQITFGEDRYQNSSDMVQAQFSNFYYRDYVIDVSSENKTIIDFLTYKREFKVRTDVHIKDYWDERDYRVSLKLSVLSKELAEQSLAYHIDDYADAFSASDSGGYSLFINKNKRIYIFENLKETSSLDEQLKINKPEILSLLNRFQPRNLYEVPTEQGFCFPYGFIAGDSGHEKRNMGVTYRLKDHPDVTIFFQDLGTNGEIPTDKGSMKEAMTRMWNSRYLMGASKKELLFPKWKFIKIDSREGMRTFVKATYDNVPVYDYKGHVTERLNYINYGYLAYVRGDKEARNKEPDLLLYVSQDSEQAKGQPPMDKDELEKMAERIVRSVKRR